MKVNSIGEFIQILRKEKGLTQKELAEIIGLSDKTISRWENGNSLPDTSMLLPLCKVFGITVNELLSCEKIAPEDYPVKAEKTIITLFDQNQTDRKSNKIAVIVGIILLFLSFLFMFTNTSSGYKGIGLYSLVFIDAPSLILLVFITAGIILVTGIRGKQKVLELISRIIIPIGVLIALVATIIILTRTDDWENIGNNMHVMLLSLVYSLLIKIVVDVILAKIKKP